MSVCKLLSVVALREDLTQHASQRGQVGTLVERLAPDVYEVEFSDDQGQTYATVALMTNQILELRHAPAHQAA